MTNLSMRFSGSVRRMPVQAKALPASDAGCLPPATGAPA